MATQEKKDNGWGAWALIVFLFAVGVWPIALVLLLVKLFGSDSKKAKPVVESQPAAAASQATRPVKAKTAAKKAMKAPVMKAANAKKLTVLGILLAALGLFMAGEPLEALFWSTHWAELYLWELLQYLAVAIGGIAMFASGRSMAQAMKRYAKYLSVLGDRDAMEVSQLARTLGYSVRRVEKDLEKMIDKGYFGGQAYLHVELGYLFRTAQAAASQAASQAEAARDKTGTAGQAAQAETGYSGILRDIRRANDRIADPVLSAKIERLEAISARIFKAVEEDPKKQARIGTFLDYYLPTTQKLLDAYGEFESAGVEGENLRQAKSRIEATMDAIVAGFEHQLDALYRADVLDVDSDLRVMETMLNRDAASVEKDFGLGKSGTSAAAAPEAANATQPEH